MYFSDAAACWEAGVWPPGMREFGLGFDVPGTPDTITLKDVKRHVKIVLMGHFDSLYDTEHGFASAVTI